VTVKTFAMLKYSISKNPDKKIHHSFHKNMNVFLTVNNNKCFLSSKSSY